MSYADDLRDSMGALKQVVWPRIREFEWLQGGELEMIEGRRTALSDLLDMFGGADAAVKTPRGVALIASRVQWRRAGDGAFPYNDFTIRLSRSSGVQTEYEKRKRAIRGGLTVPTYTVQAYCEERPPGGSGELLSVAAARTDDVVGFAMQHEADRWFQYRARESGDGNARFLIVKWHEVDTREWHRDFDFNPDPQPIACARCGHPMPWARAGISGNCIACDVGARLRVAR